MYWKNKLEGLESLSNEDWDKDLLWNQLNRRITKRRFNRTLLNGSIVLVICALLLSGLVWTSKDKQQVFPTNNIIYKPTDIQRPVYTEHLFIKEEGIFKKENKQVAANLVGNIIVEKKDDPVIVPEETGTMHKEISNEKDNIAAPTILDSTVASTSPAKRLRVVHINEVGKPVIENIKIARASQSISDRSANKVAPVYFSDNSDDNIFKINFFPNN